MSDLYGVSICFFEIFMLNLQSKKIKKGLKMSLNNYYNEIRSDIAKEFGFEAIGYGSPKLDKLTALDYLRMWEALSPSEQEALLATRR